MHNADSWEKEAVEETLAGTFLGAHHSARMQETAENVLTHGGTSVVKRLGP
jgi:hypothetical protein